MFVGDFYIALVVGLTLSLLVTEIFGILPGGLISPGYLALVCDTPTIPLLVLLISFIVFAIAKYILPKIVVLYGRRRFVAILILAVLIKLSLEFAFPLLPFATFELRGIGIIVPALIANCYFRQGVTFTLATMIPTTLMTFGALSLVYYFA